MSQKCVCLCTLILVLGVGGAAWAGNNIWDDGYPSDHNWSSANNWMTNSVPTDEENVYLKGAGAAVTDVYTDEATCNQLWNAYQATHDVVIWTGAYVDVVDKVYLAWFNDADQIDEPTVTIKSEGRLDVGDFLVLIWPATAGTMEGVTIDTSGTINVTNSLDLSRPGTQWGYGEVYLRDGTINCGGLLMQSHSAGGNIPDYINIEAGVLYIDGDVVTQIEGYIENGWIEGYGGSSYVDVDYLGPGDDRTRVRTWEATSGNIVWDDGDPNDHDWYSENNWNTNVPPCSQNNVYLKGAGAGHTDIYDDDATCNQLWNAYLDDDHDLVLWTGAYLNVVDDAYGGVFSTEHTSSTITVTRNAQLDVGDIFRVVHPTANGVNMEVTLNASGEINIGGAFEVSRPVTGYHHGTVNLLDGTITCGSFSMGQRNASTPADYMNVTGGVLYIDGNVVSQIEGYETNGYIEAFGGYGDLIIEYVAELAQTRVSADAVLVWDDGDPYNHYWSSENNWNIDALPCAENDVYLGGAGAAHTDVYIDTATCDNLWNAYLNDHDVVLWSGAYLDVNGDARGGQFSSQHTDSTFTVEKGAALDVDGAFTLVYPTVYDANMGVTLNASGNIQIGGAFEVSRPVTGYHHGTVNLLDGRINCGGLSMGQRDASTAADSMDITGGVLYVSGDVVDTIMDHVDNGYIQAYGGEGTVRAYHYIAANKTWVIGLLPKIQVVVEATLYDSGNIDAALDQFVRDLEREGYDTHVHRCSETTGEALKAYFKGIYDTDGLGGIIFIEATDLGQIPRLIFDERPKDNQYGPMDLCYADLDGYWEDTDEDGMYEVWESAGGGDMAPEVWTGRISTCSVQRLNDYFDRNHAYRTGAMTFEERALIWVEPGWMNVDAWVSIAYEDYDSYWGEEMGDEFTADLYHDLLQNSYEWLHHNSHSGANGNQWIWSGIVPSVNPHVAFSYWHACHVSDYGTITNPLAGEMVFAGDYGLASLGTVNAGGVGASTRYYTTIRDGWSLGEAMLCLVSKDITADDGSFTAMWIDWCWGTTILGDPTLRPQGEPIPDDIHITDVYWDEDETEVVLTFTTQQGFSYELEHADADAYSDSLLWTVRQGQSLTGGAGGEDTIRDDLSSYPLTAAFRFYRIKRGDVERTSLKTAAVFEEELHVSYSLRDFFLSTPLIPDEDHDSVQDVFGTQLEQSWHWQYSKPELGRLEADTGDESWMEYDRSTNTWSVAEGSAFNIVAGEGYCLDMHWGSNEYLTVRFTGYVPDEALEVSVAKASQQVSERWFAYSMPRSTTLGDLGLVEAVTTDWDEDNLVRLLPIGDQSWTSYKYNGSYWYNVYSPGVDAGSTEIDCGEAVRFNRYGDTNQTDTIVWEPWYDDPPNE